MKICTKCGESKPLDQFYVYSPENNLRRGSCATCHSKRAREWIAANPERARATSRRRLLREKYGLNTEQYDALLEAQGGCCACCGSTEPRGKGEQTFAVDHDHETGQLRGILCHPCNRAIGLLGDTAEGVRKALLYLTQDIS